jgi:hypothetical protein
MAPPMRGHFFLARKFLDEFCFDWPYPSSARFLPSIITLLNIRLIRVW